MLSKLLLLFFFSCVTHGSERPRGVSSNKASFYQAGKEFVCLTSGESFPWDFVNDDYCDCKDGSDEPGTSACSNGVFFCENRGHRGSYIISSRVNDGVCDCCDGSDEFEEHIKCVNRCEEFGRKEREERERFRQLQEQGYKIKQEYMQQGKRTKDEKRARLSELERQMPELTGVREEFQRKKDELEIPEKEAKEKHEKAWEDLKAERQAEKDRAQAVVVFAELDVNSDNVVDYVELQKHLEFDIDSDGTVSVEEAREYLDDRDSVDVEAFQTKIYNNIKDIYKSLSESQEGKEQPPEQPLPDESVTPHPEKENIPTQRPPVPSHSPDSPLDGSEYDDYEDEDQYDREYDEDDEEEEEEDEDDKRKEDAQTPEEEKMPPYDAETQKLIDAADAARNEYNDADTKVRDAENEVNGLKKYLDVDYGPDEEYSSLRGQCFEFTDREYTYKLCPFDKAVQKSKSGGMETSLGTWGHWYGPEEDKYDAMKYENGQSCWNGPNRSCHVNLHCGTENKLTGASEPSRCEYQFEFTTPSRCKQPSDSNVHDEL